MFPLQILSFQLLLINIKFCSASLYTIIFKDDDSFQKPLNICSVHRLKVCANESSHVAPFEEISD